MTLSSPPLGLSPRLRSTPFTRRVEESGVSSYTVYNHMLLPTVFESLEADYTHLKNAVQIWDVSCERQIEITGPDADWLVQMLTPRDLSNIRIGKCYYVPMVDENGGMLNDPVLLKLDERRYWFSIADSDLIYWIKGLAYGLKLDVKIREPDVSPLAIQGPKSDDLMAKIVGDEIRDLPFFNFKRFNFNSLDLLIARSGYSKQTGFEIYVEDFKLGETIWDTLFEAGASFDVRAGCPNLIERIEGGLLSYGNDMTNEHTPHQSGLSKFCDTRKAIKCVGRDALLDEISAGPWRQIRFLEISGKPLSPCRSTWEIRDNNVSVGKVTSAVWSPDFKTNVAIGMIHKDHWEPGTLLIVETSDGPRDLLIRKGPLVE
jgi:dimethylsulfoniopropionate demethylase